MMRHLPVIPRVVPKEAATVDHVVPIGDGGDNHDDNLVLACSACNGRRNKERHGNYVHCAGCDRRTGKDKPLCKACRKKIRKARLTS